MSWTLADCDSDTTLLTVNNRLAADLKGRYDQAQVAAGQQVWPSADILPWRAWLRRQYEQLLDSGLVDGDLLSPAQERLVWEDVIARQTRAESFLRPAAAAELARSAFALCEDWLLNDSRISAQASDDTRAFIGWRRSFIERLNQAGQLSAAQLTLVILDALEKNQLQGSKRLVLAGFDSLTPAQQRLFDLLRDLGSDIIEYANEGTAGHRVRVETEDTEQEIRLAACWARERLRDNGSQKIAIVSPQLAQQRSELQRIFNELVATDAFLEDRASQNRFNISLGESLSDAPLVAHAQLALRLLSGPLSLHEVGQLLRSPFIGGHVDEWERRALFDVALREHGVPQINLRQLAFQLEHLSEESLAHCSDLLARIRQLSDQRQALPDAETPAHWAIHFQAALTALGWPGEASLNSHEYQQYQRFSDAFSELSGLVKVRTSMRLGEALSRLSTLLSDAVFQPKTPPTPVQILGGLEAVEMDFDAIWLMGMQDQHWPPAPRPNPLLPTSLQRELDMPHASADRELRFASALTERLASRCREIFASHALQSEQGETRPSPLTRDWPLAEVSELVADTSSPVRALLQCGVDWQDMPLSNNHGGPLTAHGGAGLLAAQASCPFSALGRFRLDAKPLPEPSYAVDPRLLGNLVHELLQRLWQRLQTSQRLAESDNDSLKAWIKPLADETLHDIGRRRPDLFTPRFRRIEAERLTGLMLDWLDCERSRAQPFEVVAMEREQLIDVAGLQLKTRADRIDRLADGRLAMIDYKTGSRVKTDGWFDDRLTEPQLPLYCLTESDQVDATLLARVRQGNGKDGCRFAGLSRAPGFAPGVEVPQARFEDTDWQQLLAHWRRSIDDLAAEINAGRGDPTPSIQACEYCELGALCRVREMMEDGDDD